MQHGGGNLEIDQQGNGIHYGRDKRTGHDGGVKAQFFGQNGQAAAHHFGAQHGADQCGSDNGGYCHSNGGIVHHPAIHQHHFDKVGAR